MMCNCAILAGIFNVFDIASLFFTIELHCSPPPRLLAPLSLLAINGQNLIQKSNKIRFFFRKNDNKKHINISPISTAVHTPLLQLNI